MDLDEIYNLFTWSAAFSQEEYDGRVSKGIAEASKLNNIYPFIQPVLAGGLSNESVWEPCARVVAMKSDEELQPYLMLLFAWLQDKNWPGADIIFERLSRIPFWMLEKEFYISRNCAINTNDEVWLEVLDKLMRVTNKETL